MFRKSILQLRLKDKLFFLLVTILVIGGIFFGVKAGISYLSDPIKGHKQELNETKSQFSQLETTYGPELKRTLTDIQQAAKKIKNTAEQLQSGLLRQINAFPMWAVAVLGLLFLKEVILIWHLITALKRS